MTNKIIVFEEIYNYTKLILDWYLIRGYRIYYVRLNGLCKENKWTKKYIQNGRLTKIDEKYDIVSTFVGMYPDPAYDNIEKISRHFLDKDVFFAKIADLYSDKTIFDAFKKNLGGELQRFYYLNFILHNLSKVFPNDKIYFVPTLCKEGYRISVIGADDYRNFSNIIRKCRAFCLGHTNITFPLWFKFVSRLQDISHFLVIYFKIFGFLFWTIWQFLLCLIIKKKVEKNNYKFGIMIVLPKRQFANKIRKVDFLVDGNKIKRSDVLFISWKKLSFENRCYLTQNNLIFVDGLVFSLSSNSALKVIPHTVTLLLKALAYRQKLYLLDSALILLACYTMWESFKERYHIDNLITHCDFGVQSVARNILLSKANTKTWYYIDANNWITYFISHEKGVNIPMHGSAHFGYLNYDYLLVWSNEVYEYFKMHHQNIRNYTNIGCLWAEHIKELENGKIKTDFKEKLYKAGFRNGYKLVAVFDSTYFDNSITTYEDGINLLKGILRMLEDIPDIFIVFKEKKSRSFIKRYSPKMLGLLNEMQGHPRCYLPFNRISPSEAIALSDLTISFPFTSPTFEALSARKKALYYDASDKFEGTFYDKIPGLVYHNYEELLNRTKALLLNIDEAEYNRYLDEFVKGKIEPYLDGRALTRFKEILTNSEYLSG